MLRFNRPSSYKCYTIKLNTFIVIGLKNKIMVICGHTHRPHFPKVNELPYFNDGSCVRASGIQGIEIADGKIMLINWRISYDSSGDLHIKREILRGPEPIEPFDLRNSKQNAESDA